MLSFTFHSTKKSERDKLLRRKDKIIKISPEQFHKTAKPLVWEEDTGQFYEHDTIAFMELLDILDKNPEADLTYSNYAKKWGYKGREIFVRLGNLPKLYQDIKQNGILDPVHCEITGERLDGSFRTKIAMHLGIKEVPSMLHRFGWRDVSEDFLERKMQIRKMAWGKDYYEFNYGYKDWKNIDNGGQVYRENADRWRMIAPLVKWESVLDLGCNEGYISLQLARNGHKVVGIDTEWTQIAWLNRLIFEWIDKKTLNAEFYDEDILETERTAHSILMLNVLYHLPREKQKDLLMKFKGRQMIFQCNLRKEAEREKYYTSHPDDLGALLKDCGIDYQVIDWKDKPIIVTK